MSEKYYADDYNAVFFSLFYIGVGVMFSFQAYLQASGYFSSRYLDHTFFENSFENDYTFIFFGFNLVGLIIITKYMNYFSGR